ncbi:hypothetical protein CYMTET_11374 [Cymbomonas tetramitiformis]|uniref:Uncharacterized protein n=1 Tax=Cymbomonas tetramitiformis TaxID=36881 RepID=A0AAE0LDI9_9CHLO|nr:hypothetical protein CYMTET_11374 [Cymbomonas tetramitiformis]
MSRADKRTAIGILVDDRMQKLESDIISSYWHGYSDQHQKCISVYKFDEYMDLIIAKQERLHSCLVADDAPSAWPWLHDAMVSNNAWYGNTVHTCGEVCEMLDADDNATFYDIMTHVNKIKADVKDIASELCNGNFNTIRAAFMVGVCKRYVEHFFKYVTWEQWEESRNVFDISTVNRTTEINLDALREWLIRNAPSDDIESLQNILMNAAAPLLLSTFRDAFDEIWTISNASDANEVDSEISDAV